MKLVAMESCKSENLNSYHTDEDLLDAYSQTVVRINGDDLQKTLSTNLVGRKVILHVVRYTRLMSIEITPEEYKARSE